LKVASVIFALLRQLKPTLLAFYTIVFISLMPLQVLETGWFFNPQGIVCHAEEEEPIVSKEALRLKKRQLDLRRKRFKLKRVENLKKAKYHESKLVETQIDLSRTERKLGYFQGVYGQANQTIGGLKKQLDISVGETARLSTQAGKRMLSLYMGENEGFLQLLIQSESLIDWIDRAYYQQRVLKQDKNLLQELKAKTQTLNAQKHRLEAQRQLAQSTIGQIQSLQGQLSVQLKEEAQLKDKYLNDAKYYGQLEDQLYVQSQQLSGMIARLQVAASASPEVIKKSTGRFMWPLSGRMTSGFGYRRHPIFGTVKRHTGIDISRPNGTPIAAADGGKVVFAGWYGGYGKAVVIAHKNGLSTLYGHMSRISVGTGTFVNKGERVGAVGSTGYSTGAHLHFEVRVNGRPVNPLGYL
jgi:murein DD-endopeptidase MepM/ murein hydrolase activator NlpD